MLTDDDYLKAIMSFNNLNKIKVVEINLCYWHARVIKQ